MHSRVTGAAGKYLFRRYHNVIPTRNTDLRPSRFALERLLSVACAPVWPERNKMNRDQQLILVIESDLSTQRRYLSINKSASVSSGKKPLPTQPLLRKKERRHPSLRTYQEKANDLLRRIKIHREEPHLVPQKVQELLILSLSEYDSNVPSDGPLALELLNSALQCVKQTSDEENQRLLPRLFSLSCQLMLRSGHTRAVNEVHRQLWRLIDGHEEFLAQNDSLYNTHHVNDACSYFIRYLVVDANNQKQAVDKRKSHLLHRLIERLVELHRDSSVPLETNPYIEDSVILLLCNQRKLKEAYEVLRGRVGKSLSVQPLYRELEVPLVSSFTAIISGYAQISKPDRALHIIEWMMSYQKADRFTPTNRKGNYVAPVPPPNVSCFNGLLHAYARAGGKDAGFKVEKTIQWMEQIFDTMNLNTRPNETSYNICINAWARSKHPDAPSRAENLLQHLVALGESGSQVEASEEAFTAVMNAWVNSSNVPNNKETMKEVTRRVGGILDLMEQISEKKEAFCLSAIPYTVLIKSWKKLSQNVHGIEKLKCGNEILNVIERMRTKGIVPTTEFYNSILTALVEISPMSAVFYFLELEQQYCDGAVQIDTRTFNCGLNAIAVLNRPDAVKRALDISKRMFKYHETDPSILPSTFTFNIILKILSRSTSHISDAAAKADDLLSEMESMPSVTPDFISYVTCIIAWGRSHDRDKIDRVTKLMYRFISFMRDHQERSNKSNIAVFNAVLSVCHHNLSLEHSVEALHASRIVMSEIRKIQGICPDQKTYESFFKVFQEGSHVQSPSESSFAALVEEEFNHCASDGYVTGDILLDVSSVAPRTIFDKSGGKHVDPSAFPIPKAWSRNAISH